MNREKTSRWENMKIWREGKDKTGGKRVSSHHEISPLSAVFNVEEAFSSLAPSTSLQPRQLHSGLIPRRPPQDYLCSLSKQTDFKLSLRTRLLSHDRSTSYFCRLHTSINGSHSSLGKRRWSDGDLACLQTNTDRDGKYNK
jgi:hypothetical protein